MALIHCNFHSDILTMASSMDVILPQTAGATQIGMTSKSRGKRAPWLLLLHGLSDDHSIWQRRTSIERYASELGIGVVMPCVHRSFYTDMVYGLKYWTFISEELPRLVHQFFNLSELRKDQSVAGLSMGGYGAFKLALRQPDRWAGAASLSGCLDIATDKEREEVRFDDFNLIFGELGCQEGSDDDLFHCFKQMLHKKGPYPRLYQCCGTEDFLYEENQRFKALAEKSPVKFLYEEGPGSHEWGYWDIMIQKALAFLYPS